MKTFGKSITVAAAIAVGLLIAGCATASAPHGDSASDPSYSASPETGSPRGFGDYHGIFERYPELEDEAS